MIARSNDWTIFINIIVEAKNFFHFAKYFNNAFFLFSKNAFSNNDFSLMKEVKNETINFHVIYHLFVQIHILEKVFILKNKTWIKNCFML